MNFFKSLLSSKSGSISSKRFFGGLGFLVCIALGVIAVVLEKNIPVFCSELLYVCAALLGVDSVMKVFGKNKDVPKEDKNDDE